MAGAVRWPTPRNNTGPSQDVKHLSLDGAVSKWPTPCSRDWKDGTAENCRGVPENSLLGRAVHWRTPNSTDWKNRGTAEYRENDRQIQLQTQVGGKLNPVWVELLMGWPKHWTDLNPLDTKEFDVWLKSFSSKAGYRAWQDGSWEHGIPRIAKGVRHRASRLRALGNGQVPQVAVMAWVLGHDMDAYEQTRENLLQDITEAYEDYMYAGYGSDDRRFSDLVGEARRLGISQEEVNRAMMRAGGP